MDKNSRLLIADIWLNAMPTGEHIADIESIIQQEFTVLQNCDHEYTPYGLTKILILSESHCVIHTYPEYGRVSLDLFVCNAEKNLDRVLRQIMSKLPVKKFRSSIHERG